MIKVELFQDDQGRILGFGAHGHAGYGPPGEDIVCAAVSVLTIAAANGLLRFLGEAKVRVEMDERGELDCHLIPGQLSETDWIRAEAILETMAQGLMEVREGYGRYIKITKRRCVPC